MRHAKHRHVLNVKKAHRAALMANLASALFLHKRIQTTLAKAKALRPFAEKIITLACKAAKTDSPAQKVHYRRLAISKVRDKKVVAKLFDELVNEFLERPGGYTRIYKLVPRRGDAASMAIIELIDGDDEGYKSRKKKSSKKKVAAKNVEKVEPKTEESAKAELAESSQDEEQKADS